MKIGMPIQNGITDFFPKFARPERIEFVPWHVRVPGRPDGPGPLVLNGTIAQWQPCPDGYRYGLEFFGIEKPSHTRQRQALWRFLRHCQKAGV